MTRAAPDPTAVGDQPTVPSSLGRLSHIDGLRAIAAFLVTTLHLYSNAIDGKRFSFFGAIRDGFLYIDIGSIGVYIFFIISGYVISYSIIHHKSNNITKFTVSRIFRLYPAYIFAVAIAFLYFGKDHSMTTYLMNLTMIQQYLGFNHVNAVFWTLSVELAFYVSCIILFYLGIIQRFYGVLAVFAILSLYTLSASVVRFTFGITIPFGWTLWFSIFYVGVVLRQMDERGKKRGYIFWTCGVAYVASALVVCLCIWHDPTEYGRSWQAGFISWTAAIAIFLVGSYYVPLRSTILAFLGRISYSVYLLHIPVGVAAIAVLSPEAATASTQVLTLIGAFLAVIGVSALSYYLVERPGVGLGQRLLSKLLTSG